MPRESRTPSMDRKDPVIVFEGMEDALEMDLKKHKGLVERTQTELSAYRSARAHERLRKKHYQGLIGGGKFNDAALQRGIEQSDINIRHFKDKIKLSEEKIKHHEEIVAALETQLKAQYSGLKALKEYRDGLSN